MTNIHTRPPVPADEAFVFATWLKSVYYGNSWFKGIEKNHFMTAYRRVIGSLLLQSTTEVACLSDDPDVVVGYIVYSSDTLHYVYVKKAWRQLGVARKLANGKQFKRCTHLTETGVKLKKDLAFEPFL